MTSSVTYAVMRFPFSSAILGRLLRCFRFFASLIILLNVYKENFYFTTRFLFLSKLFGFRLSVFNIYIFKSKQISGLV